MKVLELLKLQDISYEDKVDEDEWEDDLDICPTIPLDKIDDADSESDSYSEDNTESEVDKMCIQSLKSSIFSERFQEDFLKHLEKIISAWFNHKPNTKKIVKFLKDFSEGDGLSKADKETFLTIAEIIELMASKPEYCDTFQLLHNEISANLSRLNSANKEKKEYINLVLEAQENNCQGHAVERIIQYMERDIESLAKRFCQFNKSYDSYCAIEDDLKQEWYIGLLKGIRNFNPNKSDNVKFYMRLWIKQSMVSYLTTKNDIIKVPAHIKNIYMNIQKIISEFDKENVSYTNKDIADKLWLTEEKVEHIVNIEKISNVTVFSAISTDNGEWEESSMDNFFFMEDKGVNVEWAMVEKEEVWELKDFIANTLSKEEQFVIIHRWALFWAEKLRLKDLWDKLNKTEERVRQIEERAKHIIAMRYFDKHIGVSFHEKWRESNNRGKSFNEKMKEIMSSL